MKKYIIIMLTMLMSVVAYSQDKKTVEYKQEGKTFVQQSSRTSNTEAKKTDYTWKIDNKDYPIYLSSKGRAYINKVSKKTGKEYKYYLPKEIEEKLR